MSTLISGWLTQLSEVEEYTDCISAVCKDSPNECLGYDIKQSDGETPVMLELWGMQSTSLLPLLRGPLWPRVGALDRVLSMSQIELNWTELFEIELFICIKMNLALNNLQLQMCLKVKPNQNSGVVVPVSISSMGQINLSRNYLYLIGILDTI